jgi:hypothetical protein
MKMTRIAILSLAVVLYATAALAQHGHSGGGTGMGAATDHGAGLSGHGNGSANNGSGSTNKATIDNVLKKNPAIGGKIAKLTGMSAQDACSGFKNLGQCVAAAHVSKNLGISFNCLKDDMTGTAPTDPKSCPAGTGTKGSMSLGKSIQALEPAADSKTESKKGQTEASQDLKSSGVQS